VNRRFRDQLKQGELLLGTFLTLPSVEIAEILSHMGFDWLFVDMEHGAFSIRDIQQIVMATEARCPCVVRTPSDDDVWIKKVLDTGAAGILIPHVSSQAMAERIIRSCKYPPSGERSAGLGRAQGFGRTFSDYVMNANDTVAIILQIEDIEGVRNIESIVEVPGTDAVFIGPYDLSGSIGKLGQVGDAEVKKHIEHVLNVCQDRSIPLGIFGMDADGVRPYIDQGFTLITAGVDALFLSGSAKALLSALRT
jgi:2-keto-3-deoxy-L-rhamnonate aldolase RhmA